MRLRYYINSMMEKIFLKKTRIKNLFLFLLLIASAYFVFTTEAWRLVTSQISGPITFKTLERVEFDKIPPETLDSKSQFFGLRYKDTYGLPSANFERKDCKTFYEDLTRGLPRWEKYFPHLLTALGHYGVSNPSQDMDKFTSPESSCTVDKAQDYEVGDTFKATIYAINFVGERKHFGGDYFRGRLINTKANSSNLEDGIPLVIRDNLNGTYTVTAPLLVPGNYKLEVTLAASIEAIGSYAEWSAGRIHKGILFTTTVLSNETVYCNSDLLCYDE